MNLVVAIIYIHVNDINVLIKIIITTLTNKNKK